MTDLQAPPAEAERRSLNAVDLLKYVGSPIAVGTTLLFYFGWVRSNEQAQQFGADISVFQMSADDFTLRSVNVVFLPLLALVISGLLFLRFHPMLREHAAGASRVLLWSWLLLPLGIALIVVNEGLGTTLLPGFVLLAVLGVVYGARLRRHARGEGPAPLAQDLLVIALILVTSFWATERVARAVGSALTYDLQQRLGTGWSLSVFSEGRLHIAGPGVTESMLTGAESKYAYRYDGLHLLQRSGDKYFLLTEGWHDSSPDRRLLVLPDDNTIRLEFIPPGGSPASTFAE